MKLIQLSQDKFVQVDNEDYEYLNQFKWHLYKSGNNLYASRVDVSTGVYNRIFMHRVIMKTPFNMVVDHRDHNGLNCQRHNIRNCFRFENNTNRTKHKNNRAKYKGVSLTKDRLGEYKYIKAIINVNKKRIYLGSFNSQEAAAQAYNEAAIKYHGEFASLNIISINQ